MNIKKTLLELFLLMLRMLDDIRIWVTSQKVIILPEIQLVAPSNKEYLLWKNQDTDII